MPGKVEIDNFFRNDDQVGCNSTRRVQWQPINTGSCTVECAIAFRNSADDTIGTIEHIRDSFYCTSGYDNANSVIIWATYKGTKGPESEANFLTDTPKPVPPTTIILPTITQKGTKHFVCLSVCLSICMYVSIYLSIFLSIYLCIYVSMYLCIYVCTFIYVHITTIIHKVFDTNSSFHVK